MKFENLLYLHFLTNEKWHFLAEKSFVAYLTLYRMDY